MFTFLYSFTSGLKQNPFFSTPTPVTREEEPVEEYRNGAVLMFKTTLKFCLILTTT